MNMKALLLQRLNSCNELKVNTLFEFRVEIVIFE